MAEIVQSYDGLSASSSRSEVTSVLNRIINAPIFTFSKQDRIRLIESLLNDLKSLPSRGCRLSTKDAGLALLAVKTLGKDPAGSTVLASSNNLSILLSFANTFKDDHNALSESLRCIANAMLLIEAARTTFIEDEVNGGNACLNMLERATSPDQIFILSRILFLSTVSGTSFLESVVEEKHNGRTVVDIIGSKLDLMLVSIKDGVPTSKEAMIDLLKFTYNLLLHYPKLAESEPQNNLAQGDDKVMGDFWSSKLDGILPPLLRVYGDLPPTSPSPLAAPLSHVIHSLITIPISQNLKPIWLNGSLPSSPALGSSTNSPKTRTPQRADSSPGSRSDSPTRSATSYATPKPSTLDRALSRLSGSRRSSSRASQVLAPSLDVVQRTYDLMDLSFSQYFPGNVDPDEQSVRDRAKTELNDSLDDTLTPLVVLLTRICIADEGSRIRIRQKLIPDDLDRSSPLEERSDLLGKILRLLASAYHSRLKDSLGELLFAIADSNATTLSGLVGYGNVAGYLFNKGFMSAPSASGSSTVPQTTPSGEYINPITGTTMQPSRSDLPEMTEEEKEQEVEKLLVLFDRLEKTGAIAPESNPIRKAISEGKINM
ncbi:guanine nucleotide exchange factor [Panaeolus papilionaceus]|nr:guanine nucleotide exchange factor [Panaeolus papilionaceus]